MVNEGTLVEYANISEHKKQILEDIVNLVGYKGDLVELEKRLNEYETRFTQQPIKMVVNSSRTDVEIALPREKVYFDL